MNMLVLCKVKFKTVVGVFFWLLLLASFGLGVCANIPEPKQAGQVNIPLYPIVEIQRELNARGHSLKEDGIWGKNSDLALTIEVAK